jgi:hypothetical protein
LYQLHIAKADLDSAALNMLIRSNDDAMKIEALKFLIKLLKYGNLKVQ